MSWEYVKLGDVCEKIGSGATPKGGSTVYIDDGTTFIRSQNVYNLFFDYNGLVFINDEAAQKLKGVTIKENDILLNITGDSVARTCLVPSEVLPARVNQHVTIVRPDNDILNPVFLNYYLVSPFMQSFMLGLAVGKGASRNAMTKDMIAGFEVPCPPMEVQQKIIDTLKPYDDLIKNNQKQIKLLEEAVQRLYKEWFVDLRFPGHKDVAIVDGVPEGWTRSMLQDVATLKAGGDRPKVFSKNRNLQCNVPVYSNGTEKEGLYGYTDIPVIQENCVTISARGSVGYTCLRREAFVPIVRLISAIPKSIDVNYLYLYLKNFKFDSNGAAQQQITVPMIKNKQVLIPAKEILDDFAKIVHPIQDAIANCKAQVESLMEARDCLLPKLMSGEIEV